MSELTHIYGVSHAQFHVAHTHTVGVCNRAYLRTQTHTVSYITLITPHSES